MIEGVLIDDEPCDSRAAIRGANVWNDGEFAS